MASCATLATLSSACGGVVTDVAKRHRRRRSAYCPVSSRALASRSPSPGSALAARRRCRARRVHGRPVPDRAHERANAFTAIDAVCTHEGCTITGADGDTYVCPCHGSRYNRSGQVTARSCQGVTASVRHDLRERRRDDRALIPTWPNSTRKSITCFAAPDSASAPRTSTPTATCRPAQAVAHLVDYEGRPDDVDARIGRPDHAQVVSERTSSRRTSTSTTRASGGCSG